MLVWSVPTLLSEVLLLAILNINAIIEVGGNYVS